MRLLLIAYEFPPSPSPQSLRWAYLCRELALLGHEVHVLAPALGGDTPGLPSLPDGIHVHRTFAGPFRGFMAMRRERRHRQALAARLVASMPDSSHVPLRPPRSWKQTIWDGLQSLASKVIFPDLRGEWKFWAWRELRHLLRELQPDAVVSSHEPATTLELGLLAQRMGFPWFADLGDPVFAGYTPPRWKRRALELERQVCQRANHVFVTNAGAMRLLRERHGRDHGISVLTQGFDDGFTARPVSGDRPTSPQFLELLYTGSFYDFRKPDALLSALAEVPDARLDIAAVTVPESILSRARQMPDRIRLLGFLPHAAVLEMQRNADVLVNIANSDPAQIPGKFYEYLGAGRPILHLGNAHDAIGGTIQHSGRGWNVENNHESIAQWLRHACAAKRENRLENGLKLDAESVAQFGWRGLAKDLARMLEAVVAQKRDETV